MGVTQIADILHLNKATVHTILRNLTARDYVAQCPTTKKYALGNKLSLLGMEARRRSPFYRLIEPYLLKLREITGHTVHFAQYDTGEVLYIQQIGSINAIESITSVGCRAPAYCVATGKVMLARLSDTELTRLCRTSLKRYTPYTISTSAKLARELSEIKSRGYALNRGEYIGGAVSVAAPINSNTTDAAISIVGLPEELTLQRAAKLTPLVISFAKKLSNHIRESVPEVLQ